jgi:signal transduction histidine kinase
MHPIKHTLEGNRLLGLRDKRGKLFFAEFVRVASEHGSEWVEYVWPKPGAKTVSRKTRFVQLVKHGDEQFIIGCGVYDWSRDDVLTWLAE